MIGYIVYRKRNVILANIEKTTLNNPHLDGFYYEDVIGSILCMISLLLRWYGSYTFNPLEYHIASLPIMVSGLLLLFFNMKTLKVLVFPTSLLLFLIPPPFEVAQQIGAFLAVFSAIASYNILKIMGYPVFLDNKYGNPIIYLIQKSGTRVPFTIDIGCSGLYSFIGLLVFATFFSYLARGSIYKKAILVLAGFPILYSLNITRISILLLVGYYFGLGVGLRLFHLLGGWTLTFLGTLLIILIAERYMEINILHEKRKECDHFIRNFYCKKCSKILNVSINTMPKTDLMKYIAIILLLVSVVSIDVSTFALTRGQTAVFIKKNSGEEEIRSVLPQIEGYRLDFIYRDTEFEKIAGQNSSLLFMYGLTKGTGDPVWVQVEISSVKSNLHNWEYCLINYPSIAGTRETYEKIDLHDIHLLDNPPLTARFFSFHEKGKNLTQVVLYWYAQSIFETDNDYRTLWSKISVIQYVERPELYLEAQGRILPIAVEIANYWGPISSWSIVTLTIAKFGSYLVLGFSLILLLLIFYLKYIDIDNRRKASILFNRITDPVDVKILESIKVLKGRVIMDSDLFSLLGEIDIEYEMMAEKLVKAEEIGLIQRKIIDVDNEPYIGWSSKV
jgi:exosortase